MSAPVATGSIPVQRTSRGAAVSIQTAPYYPDADALAVKTYSATGLPTGLSINTSTGAITGTPTVAGTVSVTVTCTTSTGPSNSLTVSIVVVGGTSAAQEFWINGTTGNDSYTGLSATYTGGSTGPWATLSRANSVQPHASGHVDIWVAPGTYRNQVYIPQYGGTNDAHRIRLRVASEGIVDILGPSSGRIVYAMIIGEPDDDVANGKIRTVRNYISMLRESETRYFRFDGEVVFGSGSLLGKYEDVTAHGHMNGIATMNGVGIVIECAVRRTIGYDCIDVWGPNCDLIVMRIDFEQHGTSHNVDFEDSGDFVRTDGYLTPGS